MSYFVEANGSKSKVLEVYESYSGWYWYITEKEDKVNWFGLVRGFETEWGGISPNELNDLIKKGKIWRVPKKNWIGVPLLSKE